MKVTYIEDVTSGFGAKVLMRATAESGGRTAVVTGLRDDEPVFVLRAQDAMSVGAISLWREMTWQALSTERLAQVDADIALFLEWRHENQAFVKDPD